ncbi:MAG: hypothetical protein CSA96_02840 [Bacteroidetes bacterium]|nr:MAG: hypothetical protein CSA96_02840 [Bacteroidota bacterium]
MKNLRFIVFLLAAGISSSLSAQLKVESGGQTLFGSGSMRLDSDSDQGYLYFGNSHAKGLRFRNVSGKMYLRATVSPSFVTVSTSTNQKNLCVMNPSGYYKFWVLGNGNVYSVNAYITSDSTKKKNIEPISNALEKIQGINGVTYSLKSGDELGETTLKEDLDIEVTKAETSNIEERSAGVLSQEVKKVLPEAVRTLEDGSEVVSYNDIVALLVEAVKEQQEQLDRLNSLLSKRANKVEAITSVDSGFGDKMTKASLLQNTPNPFNHITRIQYSIPSMKSSARVNIYDLQGHQVKSYKIVQTGADEIQIPASELAPGIFIYNLIVDGVEIASHRMVLTE